MRNFRNSVIFFLIPQIINTFSRMLSWFSALIKILQLLGFCSFCLKYFSSLYMSRSLLRVLYLCTGWHLFICLLLFLLPWLGAAFCSFVRKPKNRHICFGCATRNGAVVLTLKRQTLEHTFHQSFKPDLIYVLNDFSAISIIFNCAKCFYLFKHGFIF